MKKVFLFAVAAAALVACSNEELSTPDNALVSKEAPVNFSVYTQRGLTRAGVPGDLTNTNIGATGFGVFAYYTAGEQYDAKATPNFMYNQKVVSAVSPVVAGSPWTYEPVKYWPNEFGGQAISDEVDRVSFFAYAPWTNIDPTTGNVVTANEKDQKYNIISVNKNTATGDPMIKYVVDTDPATSVDLLWGVAAADAADKYSAIGGNNVTITAGKPFIDLVKPNDPANHKLSFNLKHALAKVKVTIDYIADAATPDGTSANINPDQTRIYVRNIKMTGFATKGALNLNNSEAQNIGDPLWKDFDGVKDLAFDEIVFQDGRKDGKEGETNGAQTNETPQGLNKNIIEDFCATVTDATTGAIKFSANKPAGVTKTPQNLFGGDENANGGYFYVIPRNEANGKVDITIAYDVETIDPALAGKLSDGETHGISIENVIQKLDIFQGTDFMPGFVYEIKIHLGMTSVKIEATVKDWDTTTPAAEPELPANQDGNGGGQQAAQYVAAPAGAADAVLAQLNTDNTVPAGYYFLDGNDYVALTINNVSNFAEVNPTNGQWSWITVAPVLYVVQP